MKLQGEPLCHKNDTTENDQRWAKLTSEFLMLTLALLRKFIEIFTHLKLCLATAIHNFNWVKITHICLVLVISFANIDV